MEPQQKIDLLEQVAEIRQCEYCGANFSAPKKSKRRYCSESHRVAAYNDKAKNQG